MIEVEEIRFIRQEYEDNPSMRMVEVLDKCLSNDKKEEIEVLYQKIIQEYEDNPNMLMGEAFDKCLSTYNDEVAKKLIGIFISMMSDTMGGRSDYVHELSNFEIEVNNLYSEFLLSDSIQSLSYAIKNLKQKLDYFKQNREEERLVMPIRDFGRLGSELNQLEYGLSHWGDIKEFIISSSNKQVDIQKGLDLDKQKLSTFFYMLDKLGFIEKETLKNRVYIKKITDKGNT